MGQMKQYGDITKLHGYELDPVDLIVGGSPCQDLSVAGKRAGLEGERSGLFMEMIRLIKEMREKTNGEKPRFGLWENVCGALSSNAGRDFGAVLGEFARIIEQKAPDVPVPEDGWPNAGILLVTGGGVLLGELTMRNTGEYPNEEKESHLWQILEANPHPKYSLSSKACQGILNRAKRRGKILPKTLEKALIHQSQFVITEHI